MQSSKTFKAGDKVRHKYRDDGQITVIGVGHLPNMMACYMSDGQKCDYFIGNLELDKNAMVTRILKDL